jgi:hypothetical protein
MIRLLKNISPASILILFIVMVLLRVPYFLFGNPLPVVYYNDPISKLLFNHLHFITNHILLNGLITAILHLSIALWINKVAIDFNLLFKKSYLPAFFFVIISSLYVEFFTLDSVSFVLVFQLLILQRLFALYKTNNALSIAFDSGIYIAIASLIYLSILPWIFIVFIALFTFRKFDSRDYLSAIVGLLIPFSMLAFYYYWSNNMAGFFEFFKPIQSNGVKLAMFTNRADYLPLIPLVLTILLAGHRLVENFYKNIVHVRKCFQVLAANLLVVLFSFYIRPSFGIHHFLLLAMPLAILLSYYFLVSTNKRIAEGLIWLFFVTSIVFQLLR